MKKYSKELKIGLVVILGLVGTWFGLNFLKGEDLFSNSRSFYSIYPSSGGLLQSNPVTLNGVQVGIVKKVQILSDSSNSILVQFAVNNEKIIIPKNSIARIESPELLAPKQIQLVIGDSQEMAVDGDTLSSLIAPDLQAQVSEQIAPLKAKSEELLASIDSAVTIVRSIFDENTRANISESFESLNRSFRNFESTSLQLDTLIASEKAKLSRILTNVESISANLAANNDNLTNVIDNFSSISDSLAKADVASAINNAKFALEEVASIMQKIDSGQGSLGQFINDEELYTRLSSASDQLDALLEDMRMHPDRYVHFSVFGRKEKNLKLTKKEVKQLQEALQVVPDTGNSE